MKQYLTAESVRAGHPDKMCDYISDSILDACLYADKGARVAVETMVTNHRVIVAGEITCKKRIDIRNTVRAALYRLGYNPLKYLIFVYVHRQSKDIAGGVDRALESRSGDTGWYSTMGAGDQGTVTGYACDEGNIDRIPAPLHYAHEICKRLDKVWKDNTVTGLGPDGKCQVTIEYENGKPVRVDNIVVSVQHKEDKDQEALRGEIISNVLWPVFEHFPFDENTVILVNPAGRFVKGGPGADTGLTGRKLMVDTYGGLACHGGGAFSGKDPTKVDRSGAYMARNIAKNIVTAGLAGRCQVSISYAIGKADPTALRIETFGTSACTEDVLCAAVRDVFNMRPAAIIEKFHLRDVTYADYSCYGHFGNGYPRWEYSDETEKLREAVRKHVKNDQ